MAGVNNGIVQISLLDWGNFWRRAIIFQPGLPRWQAHDIRAGDGRNRDAGSTEWTTHWWQQETIQGHQVHDLK